MQYYGDNLDTHVSANNIGTGSGNKEKTEP